MSRAGPEMTILDDILYLDLGDEINDPVLRDTAACIQEITPAIDQLSQRYGAGSTMAALIEIAVNLAIDCGDPATIATALRRNAEMLDVEAHIRHSTSAL